MTPPMFRPSNTARDLAWTARESAQHIRVALVTGRSPSGTDGPSPLLGPSVHFSPTYHALNT